MTHGWCSLLTGLLIANLYSSQGSRNTAQECSTFRKGQAYSPVHLAHFSKPSKALVRANEAAIKEIHMTIRLILPILGGSRAMSGIAPGPH